LSILAKPMALSLPAVLLLFDWMQSRKLNRAVILEKIPFLIVTAPIALITYIGHMRVPAQDFGRALLIWVWSFVFYIQKLLVPVNLNPLYQFPNNSTEIYAQFIFSTIAFIALIVLMAALRKNKWVLFAFMYYVFSIFFLLRFDDIADKNIVADRFMYLPSIGICLGIAVFLKFIYEKIHSGPLWIRTGFSTVIGMIAIVLSMATFNQCKVWNNSITLWDQSIKLSTDKDMAYINRGAAYLNQQQYNLALKDFDAVLEHSTKNSDAYYNRGLVYKHQRKYLRALYDFNSAIGIKDDDAQIYNNRGAINKLLNRKDDAINDFTRAISLNGKLLESYINRAAVFAQHKQYVEAIGDLNDALKLDPNSQVLYYQRAHLYLDSKDMDSALADFSKIISMESNAQAHLKRALIYMQKGDFKSAYVDALIARQLGAVRADQIITLIQSKL